MSAAPTEGDDRRGYLDTASGIPPSAAVRRALDTALSSGWADPSRRYPAARAARDLLEQARVSVARACGVPPAGLVFPAGTDAAVWLALTAYLGEGRALLVSAVEELSVWRAADQLAAAGTPVTPLAVGPTGRVDPAEVARLAGERPAVVVVADASAEIGTRQPLAELRDLLPPGTPLVVDARAVVGREAPTSAWDLLLADPRTWGGPAGPGVLAVRNPARFRPAVPRTDGALGVEPALPAVPAIAAAALALELAQEEPGRAAAQTRRLRSAVAERVPDVQILGDPTGRLGYLAMFSFLYVPADELVDELARRGWAVASGASCTSDTRRPHHVLVAIGALTHGSLRVSVGPWTTDDELAAFTDDLVTVVARIRAETRAAGL